MSKYGNKITYVGDLKFDSKKEARYYLYLREMEKRGEIADLRLQVPFEVIPAVYECETVHLKTKDKVVSRKVQPAVHYIADFVYMEQGKEVVVDVKSEATRKKEAYVLKRKMMRALLGIKIVEV